MTYTVSIGGHGNEPYEERQRTELALLEALVHALELHGGNVTTFHFAGNEVQATSFEGAQELLEYSGV